MQDLSLGQVPETSVDQARNQGGTAVPGTTARDLRGRSLMAELKVIPNATCTFCGCVCDDMELTVEDHKITKAKNACVLGKAWFLNHHVEDRPVATVEGKPV